MVGNLVNFSYEYDLYGVVPPVWIERVLTPSLECLYFYCNEILPLATNHHYEPKFLEALNGKITPVSIGDHLWWGSVDTIAKKTNSKLENHQLNLSLGLWTPAGGIIHSLKELDELIDDKRWRLKDPFLMGGTGQWRLDRGLLQQDSYRRGIEKRLQIGPLLLEASLDVKQVLGTTFNLQDFGSELLFTVENEINSQGNFQGGSVVETPAAIENDLKRVAQYWWEYGARGILEIDSFALEQGFYPCVEVNHRKTMGWFIWHLHQRFGEGKLVFEKTNGIQLNPENSPLNAQWVKF